MPGTVLDSHYAHCFGCGERHPTGLHMRVTAGEGVSLTGEFVVTADHQGAPGLAHGGLLTAAFDETLGMLMWLLRTPAGPGRQHPAHRGARLGGPRPQGVHRGRRPPWRCRR